MNRSLSDVTTEELRAALTARTPPSLPPRKSGGVVLLWVLGIFVAIVILSAMMQPSEPPAKPVANKPEKPAVQPKREWSYDQSTDRMGREHWIATAVSQDTANFQFPYGGEQHALLLIKANKTELNAVVFAIERGQVLCSAYDGCSVNVRFDNGPIRTFSASESDDHSTTVLFIDDVGDFVAALRKASTVTIEAKFYHEGHTAFTFPVENFKW